MQPIERYGFVTALLLVAVIVAIVAWDDRPGGEAPVITPANVSDAKGAAGRSSALDVVPVQREAHTAADRKTAPPVAPRLDELARNDARRDSQSSAPSPIIPTDLGAGGALDQGASDGRIENGSAGNGGTGLAGSPTNAISNIDDAVNTPPVVSLAPSPENPPSTTVPPGSNIPRAEGLPTGPLIVRAMLSDQIVAEYGPDFRLWGPNGLVRAFENANPGLDTGRLSLNTQLARPPAAVVEAARKSPALRPASEVAATPRRDVVAELPPGGRVLDAVNLTPTVDVSGRTHTVQPGETAGQIAQLYYGRASAYPTIAAANPKVDINRIIVGQVLVIPGSADAPTKAAGTTAVASNTTAPKASTSTNVPRIK